MSDETSTDFATFEQQAEGPAREAEQVEEKAEASEEAEVEQPEGEEQPEQEEAPKPKPKQPVQERIDELTRARREAEREAKYFRNLYEGKVKPQPEQAREEAPKAPDPNTYELGDLDPRYVDDLVNFRVEQGLAKGLDKIESRVAQNMHNQAGARVWEARQDEARAEFADYDEKVISGAHNWPCTEDMATSIRESDVGGKLAYHLASNPEEARRIAALTPHSQIRELGRIEARLETPATRTVKTTNAPRPPETQARGAGGHFAPNAATMDFAQFEAMANRKA